MSSRHINDDIVTRGIRAGSVDNMTLLSGLRVAIVHHWFRSYTGAERVVSALLEIFPQADLFALIANEQTAARFAPHRVNTSFLQRVPGSRRFHRHFLPLYPFALEQFDLSGYDLVISHESGPAKGVITPAHICHICYCHSPMRYIWDLHHEYVKGHDMGSISQVIFRLVAHYVRMWDLATASRVDYFVASSQNASDRIRKIYRREAPVIHPPVNVEAGYISEKTDDYYLIVGRLVDYKRVDLAIEACTSLGRRLHIVGVGPQYGRLKKLANSSVEFLGALTDEQVREQYAHCRAVLFPGLEDFGIVPVEAHSYGRPVIAYGRGGALETIRGPFAGDDPGDLSNGILFARQSAASLVEAILAFEKAEANFSPVEIARSAIKFSGNRFKSEMIDFIADRYNDYHNVGVRNLAPCF
jgi:glycosyltransferase involved in cell wall biosynthesis